MLKLIKNIISEQLLVEGRKEKALDLWLSKLPDNIYQSRTGNPSEDTIKTIKGVINYISEHDPSGNNKYLDWMVDMISDGKGMSNTYDLINRYHKNLNKITPAFINNLKDIVMTNIITRNAELLQVNKDWELILKNPKDISSFKSLDKLEDFLNYLEGYKTKSQSKKDESKAIKILDTEDVLIVSPKNEGASCKYGANTRWCTASRIENHFSYYASKGILFYILPKRSDSKLAIFIPFKQSTTRFLEFNAYDEQDTHLDFENLAMALDFISAPYIENGEMKRTDIGLMERSILDHYNLVKKQISNN